MFRTKTQKWPVPWPGRGGGPGLLLDAPVLEQLDLGLAAGDPEERDVEAGRLGYAHDPADHRGGELSPPDELEADEAAVELERAIHVRHGDAPVPRARDRPGRCRSSVRPPHARCYWENCPADAEVEDDCAPDRQDRRGDRCRERHRSRDRTALCRRGRACRRPRPLAGGGGGGDRGACRRQERGSRCSVRWTSAPPSPSRRRSSTWPRRRAGSTSSSTAPACARSATSTRCRRRSGRT